MTDQKALEKHYKTLNDQELLKLRSEGGFTPEAERVIDRELKRRNLTPEEAKQAFTPEWLDKAEAGTVGVFTLESGERVTAVVVGLNEGGDELSVKVIPPAGSSKNKRWHHIDLPFDQIISFEPQPNLMEQWPYSDSCRGKSSRGRLLLMSAIFLSMIVGGFLLTLFAMMTKQPYGLQKTSVVTYTLFVVFFTFAMTGRGLSRGSNPPFMFTCPAVRPQIPRLLWRHLGFLVALVALQTAMLAARSHFPDWWNTPDKKGGTPFELALMFLCLGLGYAQVFSNRSLLNRAHREFSTQGLGPTITGYADECTVAREDQSGPI